MAIAFPIAEKGILPTLYFKPFSETKSSEKIIFKKSIFQTFVFNKATGKKITLKDQPAPNYPGSGAFTLVNGVITQKKLNQFSNLTINYHI